MRHRVAPGRLAPRAIMLNPITTQEVHNHVPRLLQLLEEKNTTALTDFLETLHPVELVAAIKSINEEAQPELIKYVTGLDQVAGLISYADETIREKTLELLDDTRTAAVVRRLEVDDAAEVMRILPRRRRVSILKRLSPHRVKELTTLLAYDQETAGSIMTTLFVSFASSVLVEDAIRELRLRLYEHEIDPDTNIAYLYIISPTGQLEGVCSLRELLTADARKTLQEIMLTSVVSVNPEDDQERVARLIADYNFTSIPVVTKEDNKLLGIVTVDDVVDVIEEEMTEDLLKLAGTQDEDLFGSSIPKAVRSRLPWLVASWAGGLFGASILGGYSTALQQLVTLAFFMPVVFGMAGNVGSQSSTITVCGLATGKVARAQAFRRLRKEVFTGMLLGAIFAVLLGIASLSLYREPMVSVIVAISLFITMTCAAAFGSLMPMLIRELGFDPAIASGPFVTTSTDILSITIYFTVATMLL